MYYSTSSIGISVRTSSQRPRNHLESSLNAQFKTGGLQAGCTEAPHMKKHIHTYFCFFAQNKFKINS